MNFSNMNTDLAVMLLMLLSIVVAAMCAVTVKDLLKSAIALGITSAFLTVVMFLMNSYLAAVFELSVCAGLITAVFISAISLTKPQTREEIAVLARKRIKRFIYLPVLLLIIAIGLFLLMPCLNIGQTAGPGSSGPAVQEILWDTRQGDMLGLVIIMLVGVFGIVVLFKERGAK